MPRRNDRQICLVARRMEESDATTPQWGLPASPLIVDGLDNGILCCVELQAGKRIWKAGRYGFKQMFFLHRQHELLILTEKGQVVRMVATPDVHHETGRFKAIDGKTWNHPDHRRRQPRRS